MFIDAAKLRTSLWTMSSSGPGAGKTTLSGIIANEMGVNIRITSWPGH